MPEIQKGGVFTVRVRGGFLEGGFAFGMVVCIFGAPIKLLWSRNSLARSRFRGSICGPRWLRIWRNWQTRYFEVVVP